MLVVGAAIIRDGRVLAARRTVPAELAGRWELPGGKVEDGEDPHAAVVREVREELGCGIAVIGALRGQQPIGDRHVLRGAVASLVEGEPIPMEGQHDAVRWLTGDQLHDIAWLEPDVPFLAEIRAILTGEGAE